MTSTLPSTPLCSACRGIFAPGSYEFWRNGRDLSPHHVDTPLIKLHSSSPQERQSSAAAGCRICQEIVGWVLWKEEGSLFYAMYQNQRDPSFYDIVFYDEKICGKTHRRNNGRPRLHVGRSDMPMSFFESATKSRSCAWTGQADVLQLALEWLKICQDSHDCMPRPRDAWYPSRLLDVSCGDSVRLVITADEQITGDYITLSHCWGRIPFLVTTPDNISEFKAGYPIRDLPQTFQEVIAVAKYVGIRYLWIDSYCIMQGKSNAALEDWSREAQQMHKVYTNSCLNIGSAHSDDPSGGLFSKRSTGDFWPLIKWQPTCDDNEMVFSIAVSLDQTNTSTSLQGLMVSRAFRELNQCVMSSRAWIVQEVVLSTRMLTFTDKQLIWQCSKTVACEESPTQMSSLVEKIHHYSPFWASNPAHQYLPVNNKTSNHELRRLRDRRLKARWFDILNMYSLTKSSYPATDLVKAVDGIGQYFAQLIGQIYRHGTLEGTFPRALLWKTVDVPRVQHGSMATAPSWHWASQDSFYYDNRLPGGPSFAQTKNDFVAPKLLAHAFLWDYESLPDSGTARSAVPGLQWPALICVARLLRIRSVKVVDDYPKWLEATLDLGPWHRIETVQGRIDAEKYDEFKKLRPSGLGFLPLWGPRFISGLLVHTNERGRCKRIGLLMFNFAPPRNERTWAYEALKMEDGLTHFQKLLQTKPRLIVIE